MKKLAIINLIITILIGCSLIYIYNQKSKIDKYFTETISAKVIRSDYYDSTTGKRSGIVYQYKFGDKEYEYKAADRSEMNINIGDKQIIKVNPDKPEDHIDKYNIEILDELINIIKVFFIIFLVLTTLDFVIHIVIHYMKKRKEQPIC